MTYYLIRAELNRTVPEHALRPLLDPSDRDSALDAHHRLMWTLFPKSNTERDFLWRADEQGKFYILSSREPLDSRLFHPVDYKPFEPVLRIGDKLQFVLRVNATKDRRSRDNEEVKRGTRRCPVKNRRVDIVMDAMQRLEISGGLTGVNSRSIRRMDIAAKVARDWLTAQGVSRGFFLETLIVDDYRVAKLKRNRGPHATIGILDLRGIIVVHDPNVLVNNIVTGFGRSKAFGCGLMLIRRVS